jgi:hypothetical protein
MKKRHQHAVLTGDIIASTALKGGELQSARKALSNAAATLNDWYPSLIIGKLEFFGGDAWQMLLADSSHALRVAIYLRASLRSRKMADTRISIGIGSIEKIVTKQISLSTGEAFTLSGRALSKMTVYSDMEIALPRALQPLNLWLGVVVSLCSTLLARWTPRQCEIICVAMRPDVSTQEEIGKRLRPRVRKQTVARALLSAGWRSVNDAIEAFEEVSWEPLIERSEKISLDSLRLLSGA